MPSVVDVGKGLGKDFGHSSRLLGDKSAIRFLRRAGLRQAAPILTLAGRVRYQFTLCDPGKEALNDQEGNDEGANGRRRAG